MNDSCLYLSTNIPACTACTMLLNRGFSSLRLSIIPICRVKVEASQSRTSEGTASDWMSLSSSSVSRSRLNTRNTTGHRQNLKWELSVLNSCSSPLICRHRCKETKLNQPQKIQHLLGKASESSPFALQKCLFYKLCFRMALPTGLDKELSQRKSHRVHLRLCGSQTHCTQSTQHPDS